MRATRIRREIRFGGETAANDSTSPSASGTFPPQNSSAAPTLDDDAGLNLYHYLNPDLDKLENELIEKHSKGSAANAAKEILRSSPVAGDSASSLRGSPMMKPLDGSLSLGTIAARALAKARDAAKRKADPVLVQSSAVSYEGGVDSATGLYDGKGKLATIFGYEYQGEFKQGLMHGEGTIRWIKTGVTYSGTFENNAITGRGRYEWTGGDSYHGDVLNGLRHGEGSMFVKTSSGEAKSSYTGQWENGRRHGTGLQIFPDQSRYQGEWREDRRNGRGTMTYTRDSPGTYDGEWKNDVRHGQGKMKWDHAGGSFELYEGSWVRGYPHGKGVATFVRLDPASNRIVVSNAPGRGLAGGGSNRTSPEASTMILSGMADSIAAGTLAIATTQALAGTTITEHGPAQSATKAVNRYEGEFCAGKRHGFGTFVFDDGSQYEGFWRDNVKHGEGKFTTANGVVFAATFDNGVPTRPLDEKTLRPETLYVPTILPLYIVDILGPSEIASADTMSSIQALISRHYGLLRKVFQFYCNISQDTAAIPFSSVDLSAPRSHGSMLLQQFLKFCCDSRLITRHVTIAAIGRMFLQFKDRDSTTQSSAFFAESPLLAAATAAAGVGEVHGKADAKGNRRGRPNNKTANSNTNPNNNTNAPSVTKDQHGSTNANNNNNNLHFTPSLTASHANNNNDDNNNIHTSDSNTFGNASSSANVINDQHKNASSASAVSGVSSTPVVNPRSKRAAPAGAASSSSASNQKDGGNSNSNNNNNNNSSSSNPDGNNNNNNQQTLSNLVKNKLKHPWATYAEKELHNWENPSPTLQFRDFVEGIIRVACLLYNEPFYGSTANKFQLVIEEHIFRFAGGAQPLNGLAMLNKSVDNFFPLSRAASGVLSSFKPQLRKLFDRFSDISAMNHDVPRVAGLAPKESVITLRQAAWIVKLMGLLQSDSAPNNNNKNRNTNQGYDQSIGMMSDSGESPSATFGDMTTNNMNTSGESNSNEFTGSYHYNNTTSSNFYTNNNNNNNNAPTNNNMLRRRSSVARSDISTPPYCNNQGERIPIDNSSITDIVNRIRAHERFSKIVNKGHVSLAILRHLWPFDSQLRFSRAMLKKYFLLSLKPKSKKQEQKQQQQLLGATSGVNPAASIVLGNNATLSMSQSQGAFAAAGSTTRDGFAFHSPNTAVGPSDSPSVSGGLQPGHQYHQQLGGTGNAFSSTTRSTSVMTHNDDTRSVTTRSTSQAGHRNTNNANNNNDNNEGRSGSPSGSAAIDDATYESLLKSKLRVLDASCGVNNVDSTVAMDVELTFIEFVELLCRVADCIYTDGEINDKVLQLMFQNVGPIVDVAHTVNI